MTMQILLNLLIAVIWMLLHDVWNTLTFTIGFILGFFIIFWFRRFFPTPFYGRKLWAILKLMYLFGIDLILSSIVVIGQIIRPRLNIQPGIFKMKTKLKTDWELAMLVNLLTLTPGSVVMEIAPEEGILYVHAMDMKMSNSVIKTKNKLEDVIIEVMR
ncbi:Na+/H+ antiporter subunit E [Cohnella sp. LGH]|uniref:Na+/H+ antiporter subunit E n=1 Tax=Cohnella sp. LGH TaxID=1619153 RepID=UPI001ADA35E7|nr:Na+/H+ antiporter subunit E [Cohnella sp. LGH]QTH46157.1 Na+/H+ antiporter subunit E [Cohnella sp. LGH]